MVFKGTAKFGVSLVYGTLRITNLTENEVRQTLSKLRYPKDITVSKQNGKTHSKDALEEAQKLANKLRQEFGFNTLNFKRKRKPRIVTEFDEQIGIIRKALKSLGPTLSVRRGKGTAYAWIEIWGSGEFGEFTKEEKQALEKFGLNYGGNCAVISPEDRKYYVEKAKLF